jgi:hypothetical protein
MIRNLNLAFNIVRLQTIMETIQRIAPEGSPLMALAQQGAEVVNLIVVEKSVGNPQMEPSVGNNDRARHVRSEAASSASSNHRLADNDT